MTSLIWILLCFGLYAKSVLPQLINSGCPDDWVPNVNDCYKFVFDRPLVIEEASAYCWNFGAGLVSVTNFQKHEFIIKWLRNNDVVKQSTWYTSGYYASGILIWEGENKLHTGSTYWIEQPSQNDRGQWVAYGFNAIGGTYGWKNVTGNVESNFICEVPKSENYNIGILKRDIGYGKNVRDVRDYRKGPSFFENPYSTVVVRGVKLVYLDCESVGNPIPQYKWFVRNDSSVTEVTSATSSRYTMTGSRLSIQDPEDGDDGKYFCEASNDLGTAFSEEAELMFGFLGHFSNIQSAHVIVDAFTGTKIDCNPPAYLPEVHYEWHESAPIYVFIWPTNANMFSSDSGTLYVSEVQPTDADETYFCIVTLTSTPTSRLSTRQPPSRDSMGVYLGLTLSSQTDNNYGPIIHTHAFPSPMLVGVTIRLECVAYGSLPLEYSWHREDGRDFEPGTVISHLGRVLMIYNPQLAAEGNYICTCSRNTGRRASETIIVSMEAKPYFPYPIGDLFPDIGMTARWFCRAVARPKATYTWFKDGRKLDTVPGEVEVVGSILTIRQVSRSRDEGTYQCAATNQHGTTYSTGQMTVLEIPPNFLRNPMPTSMQAGIGGTLTLPCGVEAAPVPEVIWMKNGGNLNLFVGDTSGRIGMTSSYTLVINDVVPSDAGYYMCQATNSLGDAKNATKVDVIPGITISQPPLSRDFRANRTAFIFCSVSSDYTYRDLVYIWRFNGRVIDYTLSPEYVSGMENNLPGLYITHAQFKHSGVYECEAKTTLHSDRRWATITITGPPGPVAGVYTDASDYEPLTARLVWTVGPGIDHGGAIFSYDVEAETNFYPEHWITVESDISEFRTVQEATQLNKRADQRVAVLRNLVPHTNYRFRIRAVNPFGRGQEASRPSNVLKTIQTPPIKAPERVGGGGGKTGTLTIAWQPLDVSEYCGKGLGYYVYWKKPDEAKDWKREEVKNERALTKGLFTVTVGDDNYYLEYKVMVGAFNDLGPGPNSTEQIVLSAEGMPNSVPIVNKMDGINGTSVIVDWEPVREDREGMKGRVAGYRTYYYVNLYGDSPFDGTEPDPVVNRIMVKDVYGQTDHVMLIGLMPNEEYFARVQVFNTAGAGPKGEWRRGETANMVLRNFPTHVKVYPNTQESVRVVWRGIGINYDEEVVQGYIIRVWKVQEDVRTAVDTKVDKVQEAIVGELQQHSLYVLRVLGFSKAGDGAKSPMVYFSINAGQINFDPTTSDVCYIGFGQDTGCSGAAAIIPIPIYLHILILCLSLVTHF